jgi:hypothetical protein
MNCPSCGSDSTQTLVTLHSAGTTVVSTQSTQSGVALVNGNFVPIVGGSETVGTHQSLLAQRHAPPALRETISVTKHIILGIIAIPVLSGIITLVLSFVLAAVFDDANVSNTTFFLVPTVIFGVIASLMSIGFIRRFAQLKVDREWNATVHPTLLRDWERTWLCHRCGATFKRETEEIREKIPV